MNGPEWKNRLYYGDCLTVMAEMPPESVDLIYLDPPFKSNREYNAIYKDETGRPLPDQIEAFNDIWTLDKKRKRAIHKMPVLMSSEGIDDNAINFWKAWVKALHETQPSLLAYLSYMTERLIIMRRILKPTGSIYFHCDPTASHYIKIMMDVIFGHERFRNEITWKRTNAHALGSRRFDSITDKILFYARSNKSVFRGAKVPMSEEQAKNLYGHEDERGDFADTDLTGGKAGGPDAYRSFNGVFPSPGRAWAPPSFDKLPEWAKLEVGERYVRLNQLERCHELNRIGLIYWTSNGKPRLKRYRPENPMQRVSNLWTDIGSVSGDEDLGYDTQKPKKLLKRIIKAGSDDGGVVLDPFCGCATTLEVAHRTGRRWIGIDIAIHAIKRVASVRLQDRLGLMRGEDFKIDGIPHTLEGAKDLWEQDEYHFQKWAVEQVDGFVTRKRTNDGGIDGRIYFNVPGEQDLNSMVLEVKGGKNIGKEVLRSLWGVLDRDEAKIAGLIIMNELGPRKLQKFSEYMDDAGDLMISGRPYARMQMLTVQQILNGEKFDTPPVVGRGEGQPVLPGFGGEVES